MSIFDKTKCDCCVCPMQQALKQLDRETNVRIFTSSGSFSSNIIDVNDFVLFTENGNTPICNICAVRLIGFQDVSLELIKNSLGVCNCCEDPMTNLLKAHIGCIFLIELNCRPSNIAAEILDVGEGVVFIVDDSSPGIFFVISTCSITRAIPIN